MLGKKMLGKKMLGKKMLGFFLRESRGRTGTANKENKKSGPDSESVF
jgi:hypothetical protein